MSLTMLIDVTARSAGYSGVRRWIDGFCTYLESRGIPYQEISAASWADTLHGLMGLIARTPRVRELLYYSFGLRAVSSRFERVVIVDNIGRLLLPLPARARPFYLIHDLIPLEMSGGFVRDTVGWRAALSWAVSRRVYRWRLRRILFAPGARFGYVTQATQAASRRAFGRAAERGVWIGPMMASTVAARAPAYGPAQDEANKGSQPYVLALGTGDPKKGLDSLLRAWCDARVDERLQLVLFGASWKGQGHRWIEKALRDSGSKNVIHLGPVSDAKLKSLYRDAAAFVFPSYFEGLGLPPAEYCCEGAGHLILRDIPALKELYGDVATFFSTQRELVELLRRLAEGRLNSRLSPDERRKIVQARFGHADAFARLLEAVQAQDT